MKPAIRKIAIIISLLALPVLASAGMAAQDHEKKSRVFHQAVHQHDFGNLSSARGVALHRSQEEWTIGPLVQEEHHRCNDGGCSTIGCCIAADDYVPSENVRVVVVGAEILLASVTEVFLSSDTRPPI